MAAQSEAASVKVSPFSRRRWRAVLYSTSRRLALWSFRVPSQRHGVAERHAGKSPRNWRSRGPAGKNSVNELPILDDGNAVNKHKLNPLGVLQRLFIRGFVDDAIWVEHCDVSVCPYANSSFIFEHRGTLLQPLRWHQRHLLERRHQIQRLLLAHVTSQHPRVSARGSRVSLAISKMPVARDHRQWTYRGCMDVLRCTPWNDHHSTLLAVA